MDFLKRQVLWLQVIDLRQSIFSSLRHNADGLADAERFLDKLPGGVDGYLDRPVDDEYAPIAEGTKLFGDYTVDYTELKKAAGIKKSTGDGTELSGGQMQRLAV